MLEISQLTDEILIIALFLLFAGAQLFLCLKVKNIPIRLMPTILTFAATAVLFAMVYISDGWDSVGYLLLTICSAILLVGCVIAWVAFALIKLIRRFTAK